jgi:hypothetical protein
MDINDLTIGQAREIAGLFGGSSSAGDVAPTPRIVVLQRGWVVVGMYSSSGSDVTIANASIIRRWGTDKGLGQLIHGPRPNTILDPAGTVRCNILGVVATLDCEPSAWTL